MTFDQLIQHYGTQKAAAEALGVSQPSIAEWGNRGVPPLRQLQIQRLTRGKLKADRDVYEQPTKRAKAAA